MTEDVLNPCGHRNSERVKALKKLPSSICPACLCERIKKLEEILTEYGRHHEGCSAQFNTPHSKYRCKCGWDRERKQALEG